MLLPSRIESLLKNWSVVSNPVYLQRTRNLLKVQGPGKNCPQRKKRRRFKIRPRLPSNSRSKIVEKSFLSQEYHNAQYMVGIFKAALGIAYAF